MKHLAVIVMVAACARPVADPEIEDPDGAEFEDERPVHEPRHRPEPPVLALPTDDLQAVFALADRAYGEGDYATAIGYFKAIYERAPDPAMLFNIAQALRLLDDCFGAIKYYTLFLDAVDNKPRPRVEAHLARERERCRVVP